MTRRPSVSCLLTLGMVDGEPCMRISDFRITGPGAASESANPQKGATMAAKKTAPKITDAQAAKAMGHKNPPGGAKYLAEAAAAKKTAKPAAKPAAPKAKKAKAGK